ncbi:MAG TPA: hypothetical protein VFS27_01510 [Blastocatellia bacterium]|jgi:hypothetical protein|nr:hypothetical protein [Blastocatellia bacterium]
MKRLDHRSLGIALCLALFAAMTSFAQSEKVAIRMVPEPNQTVRMRTVQEMEFDITFEGEGAAGDTLPPPMKMQARSVFALTQKVGAPDKEGNITSELFYDEVSSEMTMNGQPMRLGDADNKFIGKKVVTTFNKRGEIVDFKIPPDLGLSEEAFKKILKSFYGDLSQTAIGVGEVATTPLDFTVPLPVPGAPPLKVDGQIKYTLASIEKGETGRVAKFNQAIEGKMDATDVNVSLPTGKAIMNANFKVSGGGDMVMNVEKGLLKSSDSKITFGGKMKMISESGAAKLPAMNMQGTMKTTATVTAGN